MEPSEIIKSYRLVSCCLSYPDHDLAKKLSSGSLTQAVSRSEVEALALSYKGTDPSDILARLRPVYTKLFIGTPKPQASPYESVQRARLRGQKVDLFVNAWARSVNKSYSSCGLMVASDNVEPPDHVATEAEFAAFLVSEESKGEDDKKCQCIDSRLSVPVSYKEFYREHIAPWFWALARQIREATEEPLYLYAAALLDFVAPMGKEAQEECRIAAYIASESAVRNEASDVLKCKLSSSFLSSRSHTPCGRFDESSSSEVGDAP